MKRKPTPPLIKHSDHQIENRPTTGMNHADMYHCVTCNKWVAWLSKKDTEVARSLSLLE